MRQHPSRIQLSCLSQRLALSLQSEAAQDAPGYSEISPSLLFLKCSSFSERLGLCCGMRTGETSHTDLFPGPQGCTSRTVLVQNTKWGSVLFLRGVMSCLPSKKTVWEKYAIFDCCLFVYVELSNTVDSYYWSAMSWNLMLFGLWRLQKTSEISNLSANINCYLIIIWHFPNIWLKGPIPY